MKLQHVIFVLFFFIASAFPQDSVFTPKYALSFGIGENFTLTKFNGEIAVKKILGSSDQIRFFMSPSSSDKNIQYPNFSSPTGRDIEQSSFTLSVGADYLWSVIAHENGFFYAGSGLSYSYNISSSKDIYTDTNRVQIDENNLFSFEIKLRGILGAEWMVSERIGIHSEYQLGLSFQKGNESAILSRTGYADNRKELNFESYKLSSVVVFGLSFYF